MVDTATPERLEYFLNEARRLLQQGAYRMAMTWAYHARQMAGDDAEWDEILTSARQLAAQGVAVEIDATARQATCRQAATLTECSN